MQRLWDVERGAGSTTLRAETLDALGGAGQIVADHLERAIEALTPEQREIAARLFDHLVTPSGTKIAHEAVGPRASSPARREAEIRPVVETLANHRILRTDEGGRWEIFHDVLAGAVLGWKNRHDAERAVLVHGRSRGDATAGSASSRSARSWASRWRPRSRCSPWRSGATHASRRGSRRAGSSPRARCR